MELNANDLNNTKEIDDIMNEHALSLIRDIEEVILKAHSMGKHNAIYDLPRCVDVPFTTMKDSRRRIYCLVLRELEKNNFHVKLILNKDGEHKYISVSITWASPKIQTNRSIEEKYLKTKII